MRRTRLEKEGGSERWRIRGKDKEDGKVEVREEEKEEKGEGDKEDERKGRRRKKVMRWRRGGRE